MTTFTKRKTVRLPPPAFHLEKRQDKWACLSYAQTHAEEERIASGLLAPGLEPGKPLLTLSDNVNGYALLALAAMHVGIPVAPVSPTCAKLSPDHQKLQHTVSVLNPGAVYVQHTERYPAALEALDYRPIDMDAIRAGGSSVDLAKARQKAGPDTVAKILFTPGSTGTPKEMINTQLSNGSSHSHRPTRRHLSPERK